MKGILLLNGEPYTGEINADGALVICCDGAYDWAHGKVRIDKNVGDFDSVKSTPCPPPEEIYPAEKDYTDGEIALFKLIDAGVEKIEIYGAGGGREDHFLGNLQLIFKAFSNGVYAEAITGRSVIFCAEGKIPLGKYLGKTFSVFPFCGQLHINDFKGVKYAYPKTLSHGECRGVSNVVERKDAFLDVKGVALIIVNRGEV